MENGMENKISLAFRKLLVKSKLSFNRFPESISTSILLVILIIISNHTDQLFNMDLENWMLRIIVVLTLVLPVTLCFAVLNERNMFEIKIRYIVDGAIFVLAILYLFLIPKTTDGEFFVQHYTVSFILLFIFTLIPYFHNRDKYSLYVIKLVISFLITYFYILILYGGLTAIISLFFTLFNIGGLFKINIDFFVISVGIFGVIYYLANIPKYDEEFTIESYPKVVKVLLTSIVMPLLSVYMIVQIAYLTKSVLTGDLYLLAASGLIIPSGILGVIVLFAVNKLDESSEWVNKFKKYFPYIYLLPLLVLLIVTISDIVNQGITSPTYLIIVSFLWMTTSMVLYVLGVKFKTIYINTIFSFLSIITVVGPISVFNVVGDNQFDDLSSDGYEYEQRDEYNGNNEYEYYFYHVPVESKSILIISDYDYSLGFFYGSFEPVNQTNGDLNVSLEDGELVVTYQDKSITKPLSYFGDLAKNNLQSGDTVDSEDLTFTIENSNLKVTLVFESLDITVSGNEVIVEYAVGNILIELLD